MLQFRLSLYCRLLYKPKRSKTMTLPLDNPEFAPHGDFFATNVAAPGDYPR